MIAFLAFFSILVAGSGYVEAQSYCSGDIWSNAYSSIYYNTRWSPSAVSSSGKYMVCPGTTFSVVDISTVWFLCSNDEWIDNDRPNLQAWIYNSDTGAKLSESGNYDIVRGYERWQIIGPSSRTIGSYLYSSGSPSTRYFTVYTFNNPGNYKVWIDLNNAFCRRPYFACPWLGGTWRSHICDRGALWYMYEIEGWDPLKEYSIVVVNPSISVTNKASETAAAGSQILLHWKIKNDGNVEAKISIASDCGGWSCSFLGYSGGTIYVPAGAEYCFILNVTVPDTQGVSNNVGVKITYDDNYGLTCIAPKTLSSYTLVVVPFGGTTTTTSTTTTMIPTPTPTPTVTPLPTPTPALKDVTFFYNVTDDYSPTLVCDLYADIYGTWEIYDTKTVSNGGTVHFTVPSVAAGTYSWNVNCTDNAGKSDWGDSTWKTVIA